MEPINLVGKAGFIRDEVCAYFQLSFEDIVQRDKHEEFVYPRQVLTYLLRFHTKLGPSLIGRAISRNHATLYNSVKRIKDLMDTCENTRRDMKILTDKIERCLHT